MNKKKIEVDDEKKTIHEIFAEAKMNQWNAWTLMKNEYRRRKEIREKKYNKE